MLISQNTAKKKKKSHGKITERFGDSHRIVYIKNRKLRLLICLTVFKPPFSHLFECRKNMYVYRFKLMINTFGKSYL